MPRRVHLLSSSVLDAQVSKGATNTFRAMALAVRRAGPTTCYELSPGGRRPSSAWSPSSIEILTFDAAEDLLLTLRERQEDGDVIVKCLGALRREDWRGDLAVVRIARETGSACVYVDSDPQYRLPYMVANRYYLDQLLPAFDGVVLLTCGPRAAHEYSALTPSPVLVVSAALGALPLIESGSSPDPAPVQPAPNGDPDPLLDPPLADALSARTNGGLALAARPGIVSLDPVVTDLAPGQPVTEFVLEPATNGTIPDVQARGEAGSGRGRRFDLVLSLATHSERERRVVQALRSWAHEWPGLSIAAVGRWPKDAAKVPGLQIMPFRDPLELQALYSASRFVLNTLRAEFTGYSHTASARPFEAAVAGSCLITERFAGLEAFLEPGVECVVLDDLREIRLLARLPESERVAMSARGRARVIADCLEAAEELGAFLAGCSRRAPRIAKP